MLYRNDEKQIKMDTQSLSYENAGADVDGHLPKQSARRQNDETNHGHEADQLPDIIGRATHEQRRERAFEAVCALIFFHIFTRKI